MPSPRRLRQLTEARVLDVDPELAADIAPNQHARAIQASRAPVRALALGEWQPEPSPETTSWALIIKGMVMLRMDLAGSSHLEVLGRGDVLNPWRLPSATRA